MQIMGAFARRKFPGALFGRKHWPTPKEVRETFEELGLVFLKFGQVLALRRDLIPAAYVDELELLHDQLPAMGIEVVRATVEAELGAPLETCFPRSARRRSPLPPSPRCMRRRPRTAVTWPSRCSGPISRPSSPRISRH